MSKVLLIGRGPLPCAETPQLGFSQLRTAAFYEALLASDHTIRLLVLVPSLSGLEPLNSWAGLVEVVEEGPGWIDAAAKAGADADIIVSAGPYNPGRLASAIADNRPFWADIPGDPLAELSALSQVTQGGLTPAQIAASHGGAMAVLDSADAVSVISGPQRFSTLGQLGLVGRTLEPKHSPPVIVVPITANFGFEPTKPRAPSAGEPLVVAISGAFNPWVDDQAIARILEGCFAQRKDLNVVCTGGGIDGFYTEGYDRFKAFAARHPTRIKLHGWLPHHEMAKVLRGAHAGLSIDKPGLEPELGSRTRLLLFAHMGLMPISTVRCEMAGQMAAEDALCPLPFQDILAATQMLAALKFDLSIAEAAQRMLTTKYAINRLTTPLIDWCNAPKKTATTPRPASLIASELDASRDALKQIYTSPTWLALNRLHSLGQVTAGLFKSRPK